MMKAIIIVIILNLIIIMSAMACTTLLVTKGASEKARELFTTYCKNQANQVVKNWWEFAWTLVARYDDGYVNSPEKMIQEVGYPKSWLDKSEWLNGSTTYEKHKDKPTR